MSHAANIARQEEQQFLREAKQQGFFVGAIVGFTAGIIFACAWVIAWAMFFRG